MKSINEDKSKLTNELENIAAIREAEQEKKASIEKAKREVAGKIAAAAQEADKVKETVINDARSERRRMVQQAIDQAKEEAKVNIGNQVHFSNDLFSRGQKWVSSAAEFAEMFILGLGQGNKE